MDTQRNMLNDYYWLLALLDCLLLAGRHNQLTVPMPFVCKTAGADP